MPLPSKRRSLWGQFSVLQAQAAGQPCHNFFCIFRCMRKGQVSLSFTSSDSSVQIWALGFLLYIQCRSSGQQQWLFCCITQAQSGMSGVSSWVRKQNSSVRQNLLIATVLLSRGFVGLCACNDNFFSLGSRLGKSKHVVHYTWNSDRIGCSSSVHHLLNPVFHSVTNIDSVTSAGGSFSALKFPLTSAVEKVKSLSRNLLSWCFPLRFYVATLLRKTSETLELAFIMIYLILQNSVDGVSKLGLCRW